MACIIQRDNKGKLKSVKAANGKTSVLYNKINAIPFVVDNEAALKLYGISQDKTFRNKNKRLILDRNNEPELYFISMSDNSVREGHKVFDNFGEALTADTQGKGIKVGFFKRNTNTLDNFVEIANFDRNSEPNTLQNFIADLVSRFIIKARKSLNLYKASSIHEEIKKQLKTIPVGAVPQEVINRIIETTNPMVNPQIVFKYNKTKSDEKNEEVFYSKNYEEAASNSGGNGITISVLDTSRQEVIQSLVEKLSQGGLSKSINLMTQAELQKVLEDLGVDATLAKQVLDRNLIWISNALNGISKLNLQPSKPEVWVKKIAEAGGKGTTQELEWIGLQDYLNEWVKENNAKSVPKEVVEQYINDNQIEIVEIKKGDLSESKLKDRDAILKELERVEEDLVIARLDGNKNKISELKSKENELFTRLEPLSNRTNERLTKYSEYQLEGGEKYREVLLTLPSKNVFDKNKVEIKKNYQSATQGTFDVYYNGELLAGGYDLFSAGTGQYGQKTDSQLNLFAKNLYEKGDKYNKIENKQGNYKSFHWDESNILAHLRLNERTLPNGERVLFIEEVQSDWAQEGRKRGFGNTKKDKYNDKNTTLEKTNYGYKLLDSNGLIISDLIDEDFDIYTESEAKENAILQANSNFIKEQGLKVPQMPYKKTDQWVGMAMRRAMQMAAQEGFDRIAWVTGEQSADRYDLSQQVNYIERVPKNNRDVYVDISTPSKMINLVVNTENGKILDQQGDTRFDSVEGKNLEDVIGKEMAQKVLSENTRQKFEGQDLKVGGKGMKAFYNSILPKVAKKEAQRFDKNAKVEVVEIEQKAKDDRYKKLLDKKKEFQEKADKSSGFVRDGYLEDVERTQRTIDKEYKESKQFSIKLTPKIKESTSNGIPLFQKNLSEKGITPTIAGFVNQKTGDVYIDKDNPNIANTLIHEHGHLLLSHLEASNPETYDAAVELIGKNKEEAKEYIDYVKQTQPNLKEGSKRFNEEVLAQVIGDNGARLLESQEKPTLDYYKKLIKDNKGELTPIQKERLRDFLREEQKRIQQEEYKKSDDGIQTIKQAFDNVNKRNAEIASIRTSVKDFSGLEGDVNANTTYHFTDKDSLLSILNDNLIEGYGEVYGISTTTNEEFGNTVRWYGENNKPIYFSDGGVRIDLDLQKIKSKFKLKTGGENVGTFEGEYEVKVRVEELENATDYISNINIDTTRLSKEDVLEIEKRAKELGISVTKVSQQEIINKNSIKEWLNRFWSYIKESLGLSDFTADQVRNMTLKEFGEAASVSILRGDYNNSMFRDNTRNKYFDGNTKLVARERFKISELKLIGKGSDRSVFDLGDGKVLKIAHTARGLEQNIGDSDYYLQGRGVIPEIFEVGLNYVVSEKVNRAKKSTKIEALDINTGETIETTVGEMLDEFSNINQKDFINAGSNTQDILSKYGMVDILDYRENMLFADFANAINNWGVKDKKPIHIDGGTFAMTYETLVESLRNKGKGKNLNDPEFREIYDRSRAAKKEYNDTDKYTMFQRSIREEVEISQDIESNTDNLHVLEGEIEDVEWLKEVMKTDAVRNFGTSKFLKFIEDYGQSFVEIDAQQVEEIVNPKIELVNNETGKKEEINVEEVVKDIEIYGDTKIPNVRGLDPILMQYYMKQALEIAKQNVGNEVEETISEDTLMDKLKNFANKMGIAIDTLENYMKSFELRTGKGITVEALADMMRKIIALSDSNDLKQLTEEIAHFAIEYFSNQDVINKMLEKVVDTIEYKQNADLYRQQYGQTLEGQALENKVRKEVLGKILQQKILDNFNEESATNSSEVGIFYQLKQKWEQFLNLFKKSDANKQFFSEFGRTLDDIAAKVLEGDINSFQNQNISNEVYFSLSEDQKRLHDSLEVLIQNLINTYSALKQKNKVESNELSRKIKDIQRSLVNGETFQALNTYLSVMNNDLVNATNVLQESAKLDPNNRFDNITKVDAANIDNFTNGLNNALSIIRDRLANERSNGTVLTKEQVNILSKTVDEIDAAYGKIKNDLADLSTHSFKKEATKLMRMANTADYLIKKAWEKINNAQSDINSYMTNLAPFQFINNQYGQIILAIYYASKNKERQLSNQRYEDLLELTGNLDINFNDTKKLQDRGWMVSAFNYYQLIKDFNNAQKEIEDRFQEKRDNIPTNISEERRQDILEELELEEQSALLDLNFEWKEMPFTREFYTQLKGLGKLAKAALIDRSVARNKIFSKYYDKNGNLPKNVIFSGSDLIKLEQIQTTYKSYFSEYHSNGIRKSEDEVRAARQLIKYQEDNFNSNNQVTLDRDAFEREWANIRATKTPAEQGRWRRVFAVDGYNEEDSALLDGETLLVDENATVLDVGTINQIKNNLQIQGNIGLQELYDRLIEKRRRLVQPYKQAGEFNEIKGDIIANNGTLRSEIEDITYLLSKFKFVGERDKLIESVPNKAYLKKVNDLSGRTVGIPANPKALAAFHREHSQFVAGQYIPKSYYYKTFRLVGIPLTPQPNFFWADSREQGNIKNPNYKQELAGKAFQPKKSLYDKYINKDFHKLFGIDPTQDVWGLDDNSVTKNKDLWKLRKFLLENKEKDDHNLVEANKYYLLPQVLTDSGELLIDRTGTEQIKGILQRKFGLTNQDELGQIKSTTDKTAQKIEGVQGISKYYTNVIEDYGQLSVDTISMYLKYGQMAISYQEKNKALLDVNTVIQQLRHKPFENHKTYEETNLKKAIDNFIDTAFYGHVDSLGYSIRILGKEISTTKVAKAFYGWVSNTNLGANIYVPTVGLTQSALQQRIQAITGGEITNEGLNYATVELLKHLPKMVTDIGKIRVDSLISKLNKFSGINDNVNKRYEGVLNSAFYRESDSALYKHYEAAAALTGTRTLLAVYDNYRLYNGKFIQRATFREQLRFEANNNGVTITNEEIDSKWKELRNEGRTFFNYIKERENDVVLDIDKLKADGYGAGMSEIEIEESINQVTGGINRAAENLQNRVEGLLSVEERVAIQKNNILMFFTMHRGWFLRNIAQRFHGHTINLTTGTEQEGSYITAARLFSESFKKGGILGVLGLFSSIISLGAYQRIFTKGRMAVDLELAEFERVNLRQLKGDLLSVYLGIAIFLLLNLAADDDDNEDVWSLQYAAYIASRHLSETFSTQLPFAASEVINIINSPVAGKGIMEDMIKSPQFIASLLDRSEVEKGAYKGVPNNIKELVKKSWFKNIYEPYKASPRAANLYFRNQTLGGQMEILKAVKGERSVYTPRAEE